MARWREDTNRREGEKKKKEVYFQQNWTVDTLRATAAVRSDLYVHHQTERDSSFTRILLQKKKQLKS